MASIKPTIYLVKENITDPKKIFKKGSGLTAKTNGQFTLFYQKSKPHTPDWFEFLAASFDVDEKSFKNSSSKAVLVVDLNKRLFAIPLGSGIHFIESTTVEYNFGLKTALNSIPKAAVRQIDTTTPEVNSQKTKKQAAVGTTPEEMGINKQKDILRGVTGKLPGGHKLGKSLEGKDSIRLSIEVKTLAALAGLCQDVFNIYITDSYKADYGWIDNIGLVRDNLLIEKLNKELAKTLRNAHFENMHFVPPVFYEMIFDYQGFTFTSNDGSRLSKKDAYEMPDMNDWKSSVDNNRKDITVDNLDNYKVVLMGDETHANFSWPIQRCLSWETDLNKERYILSEGSWYNVARDFYKEVDDFYIGKLKVRPELTIPSKTKIRESEYNEEIADSSSNTHLFDLGNSKSRDKHVGTDRNEICDVYDVKSRTFYHVKMGKASSDISHLFRQGAFSGSILKRDESACKQFIAYLVGYGCKSDIITLPYSTGYYEIAFVLVLSKTQKKDIPFFSKVSLRDVTQTLELIGYKCSLAFVGGGK